MTGITKTSSFSGNYNDLFNKPSLFSGSWDDLSDKPELFDGTWGSLTGKPTLFDGSWNSLSDVPDMNSLTANWQANLLDCNTFRLRTGAVAGQFLRASDGNGNLEFASIGASQVYKGVWNANTNSPSLADNTGEAGWWYRVTVGGTVDLGSGNITFEEGDDVSHNGTIWERIPAKDFTLLPATASDLGGVKIGANVNVAGDGTISVDSQVRTDWNESNPQSPAYLVDKPSLFSGSWNDLTDKPTIPSDINELSDSSNLLFSGSWNDLSNKPTIPVNLGDLNGVNISSPMDPHGLFYDPFGGWTNRAIAFSDLPAINHNQLTGVIANQHIDWTNTTNNLNTSGSIQGNFFRSKEGNGTYHMFGRENNINPTSYFVRNQGGDYLRCVKGTVASWGSTSFFRVDYDGNTYANGIVQGNQVIATSNMVINSIPVRSMAHKAVWQGTQVTYDMIPNKDANTIYLIEE